MLNGRRERGQELVEYALILPILIALLLGIVELSLVVFSNNTIGDAAEQGARYGVIKPMDCDGIKAKVNEVTNTARLQNVMTDCTLLGGYIQVTVTYDYYSPIGLFDALIGHPLPMKAVATMVTETAQ